jgi:hypothetical protein
MGTWAQGTHPPKLVPACLPALPLTRVPACTIANEMSSSRAHLIGYRTHWRTRFPRARTWAQGITHSSSRARPTTHAYANVHEIHEMNTLRAHFVGYRVL